MYEFFFFRKYKTITTSIIFFAALLYSMSVRGGLMVEDNVENFVSDTVNEINLHLRLNNSDWVYALDEKATFEIVLEGGNTTLQNSYVDFTIGPEKMAPIKEGEIRLNEGKGFIDVEGMKKPGFLRCEVTLHIEAKKYTAVATAAYAPEDIKPTGVMPHDFKEYWDSVIQKAKSVPLNTQKTFLPQRSTELVDVYQVEYQFYNDSIERFYGVLSVPKSSGKYPAVIRFPGAGWTPLSGDQGNAAKGYITLDLYIHGHPVVESSDYYEKLKNNELKDYMYKGVTHRDSFYYKNVILGCVRSIDLIYSLSDFNGRIGVWGSSQGGALSIITTSLDSRVNYFVALCPAMCDYAGYSNGRAGGWPHFFKKPDPNINLQRQILEVLSYFDVVNFCRKINVPGYFSWGFNDTITPPTSFYSAFNTIKSPKSLFVIPEGVHEIYPEQTKKTYDWLLENLK